MSAKRKTCSRCGKAKPIAEFRPNRNQCIQCYKKIHASWVKANPEKLREYKKQRYKKHAPPALAKLNEYQLQCRKRFRARTKKTARQAAPNPLKPPWPPGIIARLGKETDRAIAKSTGLTASTVGDRRRKLGIPPLVKPKPRWTKAMISRLGKETDAMIAHTYGLDFYVVKRMRQGPGIPGWRKK